MRGNLETKFAAHGTEPLELWGGQVGLEKHTKSTILSNLAVALLLPLFFIQNLHFLTLFGRIERFVFKKQIF